MPRPASTQDIHMHASANSANCRGRVTASARIDMKVYCLCLENQVWIMRNELEVFIANNIVQSAISTQ